MQLRIPASLKLSRIYQCSLHELSFLSTKKNHHRCLSVGTSVYFG